MRLYSASTQTHFTNPQPKNWFARLWDSIWGQPAAPVLRSEPLTPPEPGEGFTIEVPPASNGSSMEIFQHLLTDATTELASRYALLIKLDPSSVFTVREVSIDLSSAPDQFGSDILAMSPDVRNRVIALIMQASPNAKELLWLQDLFGSTLVADINTVHGQLVTRMAAYSGCRFQVKFKFEGALISRPAPLPTVAPAPEPAAITPKASAATATPLFAPEADDSPANAYDTPIRPAKINRGSAFDTPIAPPARRAANRPVAQLHLRSSGKVATVALLADGFPYTVGRHEGFKGYSVLNRHDSRAEPLLAQAEPAGSTSFASRGHLVLDGFDAATQQFRVVAKGKNGTFFKSQTMPSHFLLPLSEMVQGDWLRLGGNSGDGILEVRMEAA